MPQELPIGVQSFVKLREADCVYVDKTALLYRLVKRRTGAYFLSRPRRFGKSLTLSTLEEIFLARRDLFTGLAIDSLPYDWPLHPVLYFDFSEIQADSPDTVEKALASQVKNLAIDFEINLEPGRSNSLLLSLLKKLAEKKGPVVVLVDEYDKPLLNSITDGETARRVRDLLRGFFVILKSSDRYLRFVFLTGVSKFSKAGVFSGLNNLDDISFDTSYAELLGYTEDEIKHYFKGYLDTLSQVLGLSRKDTLERMRNWYNGYRFSDSDVCVYNPFSTLLLFARQKFQNFWFETGTPTFLLDLLRGSSFSLTSRVPTIVGASAFASYDIEHLSPLPILLQTGYLTIADYNQHDDVYKLDYPNKEVRDSFNEYLLTDFANLHQGEVPGLLTELVRTLKNADVERFIELMQAFFANIPYNNNPPPHEAYYQTILHAVFVLLGARVHSEVRTNRGRIDTVVELDQDVWLFEFKLDDDAKTALRQIRERGYAQKYESSSKTVHLVGIGFDSRTRQISDWIVEIEKR